MPKHPRTVIGWRGNNEELADRIGNTTYDTNADILEKLGDDFFKQGLNDYYSGKKKLPKELFEIATELYNTSYRLKNNAWKICKPFMKEEFVQTDSNTAPPTNYQI